MARLSEDSLGGCGARGGAAAAGEHGGAGCECRQTAHSAYQLNGEIVPFLLIDGTDPSSANDESIIKEKCNENVYKNE
jgi:hypothetical protein